MLHACQARGRNGHRHGHGLPNHGAGRAPIFHVHRHALPQFDFLKITFVGAVSALCPRTTVGIIVEHARHAFLRQHTQFFDGGDDGHGYFLKGINCN